LGAFLLPCLNVGNKKGELKLSFLFLSNNYLAAGAGAASGAGAGAAVSAAGAGVASGAGASSFFAQPAKAKAAMIAADTAIFLICMMSLSNCKINAHYDPLFEYLHSICAKKQHLTKRRPRL